MAMAKIKKGDTVEVLAGRDKGRQGQVLTAMPAYLIVEDVNMKSYTVKANPQQDEEGGIKRRPAKIARSKVALVSPTTGKRIKVGIKILENGSKVRVDKHTGEPIDQA